MELTILRTHCPGIVSAFVMLLLPVAARADEPSPWAQRRWALEVHAGFGTPVGFLGGFVDYALLEALSLEVGAGVGSGRYHETLHVAAGARVRLWAFGPARLYIGAAYSTGGFLSFDYSFIPSHDGTNTVVFAARAHWVQPSLGLEWRTRGGFTARIFYGLGFMLNPQDRICVFVERDGREIPCGDSIMGDPAIQSIGGALGYAF